MSDYTCTQCANDAEPGDVLCETCLAEEVWQKCWSEVQTELAAAKAELGVAQRELDQVKGDRAMMLECFDVIARQFGLDACAIIEDPSLLFGRVQSAELGCEIAYRREPTADEAEAFKFDRGDGTIVETHVPMGNWHGHRCTCGKWVWGVGTVCQGCVDAQAVRTVLDREAQAKRQTVALRAALANRDERLSRVATWDVDADRYGRQGPWCACCEMPADKPHAPDCPLAGWEPYHA